MNGMDYLKDGDAFLKAAAGGRSRPAVFSPEIVYNLLAMSIEKYFMGMLAFHGDLADNHTFSDLIDSLERHMPLAPEIVAALKELEQTQNICPIFEGYQRHEPDRAQLARMVEITERLKQMAYSVLLKAA